MRVRLLIDIETGDLPRLQEYVANQPGVRLNFSENAPAGAWEIWGRFVGAKEAIDGLHDTALMDPYDRQAERDKKK